MATEFPAVVGNEPFEPTHSSIRISSGIGFRELRQSFASVRAEARTAERLRRSRRCLWSRRAPKTR
jgi:hypothetical protein